MRNCDMQPRANYASSSWTNTIAHPMRANVNLAIVKAHNPGPLL